MDHLTLLLAKERQAGIRQDMDRVRRLPGPRRNRKASAILKGLLTQFTHGI